MKLEEIVAAAVLLATASVSPMVAAQSATQVTEIPPTTSSLVEIAWDATGGFERTLELAPGKFAELCGKLPQGQSVAWSFKSPGRLDFNIHYHEGKKVVFPAKHRNTAALDGELQASVEQDYCWMWQNKAKKRTTLAVKLRRR